MCDLSDQDIGTQQPDTFARDGIDQAEEFVYMVVLPVVIALIISAVIWSVIEVIR